jgi:hypothetical protein
MGVWVCQAAFIVGVRGWLCKLSHAVFNDT